jgi:murein endopeptidase
VLATLGFASHILLKVQSTKNPLLWDTVSVAERVPDLELLPESAYYVKIGGRCNHYGPRDDTKYQGCRTPDNNHWGALRTLQGIDSIAAIYHRQFPADPALRINDISLPMGGRFDIYAQWAGNQYHQYHRFGKDVDVDRTSMPPENEEEFVRICMDNGVTEPDPENEAHYHLYFWNRHGG